MFGRAAASSYVYFCYARLPSTADGIGPSSSISCTFSERECRKQDKIPQLPHAPTALAACCGFDLCYKYIWYLIFVISHGEGMVM